MAAKEYFAQLLVQFRGDGKHLVAEEKKAYKRHSKLKKDLEKPTKLKVDISAIKKLIERGTGAKVTVKDMATEINRLNAENEQAKKTMNSMAGAVTNMANKVNNLKLKLSEARANQLRMNKIFRDGELALKDFDKMMSIAFQKLVRYRMIFYTGRAALRAYKAAIQENIKVMYEMVQIQKVMDTQMYNRNKIWKLATDTSKRYGISIKETLKGMKIWAQQGRELNEIVYLHNSALTLQAIAGMSTTDSVEALTAATNAYKLSMTDLPTLIDAWQNVQRRHAVTARDLANAMKLVANAADQVGVDMYDLAASVTAVVAVTRKSGTAVANSLKTMFSRFTRPVVQNVLVGVGVSTREAVFQMRDMDDVLDDLFVKWDSLNDVQRKNIAYAFGGVRRYADFLALMENYGEKLQAAADAHASLGESERALEIELSSMKKILDTLVATTQELGIHMGSVFVGRETPIHGITVALKKMSQTMPGLAKGIGLAVGGFGKFLAILTGFVIFRQLRKLLLNFSTDLIVNSQLTRDLANVTAAYTKQQLFLEVAYAQTRRGVQASIIWDELKKREYETEIEYIQRLKVSLVQLRIERMQQGRFGQVKLAARGLYEAVGGAGPLIATGVITAYSIFSQLRQKNIEKERAFQEQLIATSEELKASVKMYELYAKKIEVTIDNIERIRSSTKSYEDQQREINDNLDRLTKNVGYFYGEVTKRGAAGFELLTDGMTDFNDKTDISIEKLQELRLAFLEAAEAASAAYHGVVADLTLLGEAALQKIVQGQKLATDFGRKITESEGYLPAINAQEAARLTRELLASQGSKGVWGPAGGIGYKLGFYDTIIKDAENFVIDFNKLLDELKRTGGPEVNRILQEVFPENVAPPNWKAAFTRYLDALGDSKTIEDYETAWENLKLEMISTANTVYAAAQKLPKVFGDVNQWIEGMRLSASIVAEVGVDVDISPDLAEKLADKWNFVLTAAYKSREFMESHNRPLGEFILNAIPSLSGEEEETLNERGKSLKRAIDGYYAFAGEAAAEAFAGLTKKAQEQTSEHDIFQAIIGKFEEEPTYAVQINTVKDIISKLGVEINESMEKAVKNLGEITAKTKELLSLEKTIDALKAGGATDREITDLLYDRLRLEKELEQLNKSNANTTQKELDHKYELKEVELEISIIYNTIMKQTNKILKDTEKLSRVEKQIMRTVAKVAGYSDAEKRLQELAAQLTVLKQQQVLMEDGVRAMREQLSARIALVYGTEEHARMLMQIDDLEGSVLKNMEDQADIAEQIRMLPLLQDLEDVQKYIKNTESYWKSMIGGIVKGIVAIPDILEDNYEKQLEWEEKIADKRDELNQKIADLEPSSESYETELAYIDALSEKIREAEERAKSFTGAVETLRGVGQAMAKQVGSAYANILQDSMSDTLQKWITGKQKYDFEGKIIRGSEIGAQKFYDAIVRASQAAQGTLPYTTEPGMSPLGVHYLSDLGTYAIRMGEDIKTWDENSQQWVRAAGDYGKEVSNALGKAEGATGETNWQAFAQYGSIIAASMMQRGKTGASQGASLFGGMASMGITAAGVTGGWAVAAPILGSLLGGLVGPHLFKDEELDLNVDALEDNTNAVNNNTRAIEELTERLIKAPSTFTLPALAGIGGGGGTLSSDSRLSGTRKKYLA